ncbi:HDOD domain-containing protein [Thiomicrorhabdus xiamenensis]|uniref:HDOD domain-containing protein n=1 Tax=Thiomicrorhabdus xiamenensis TaxID=2739063 RepID=A0A7D4T9U3_9GAMM|nr:HDOD domain-containing protein [Thiomicrorhabdus xiamenensis]QKI88826.1 HDOD domain-containing protein [Thiomicrorhabdus xiamenensis]
MQEQLRAALNAIRGIKIPEFPQEVIELEREINSALSNTQRIVEILEQNVTLSGEVMRLVNSPVIKLREPVNGIREAVFAMGLDNLYNLVVAAAFQRLFSSRGLHRDILDHSVDVAFCMAYLTEFVHGVTRDQAYMLGLFHNAGSLMLTAKDEEAYDALFRASLANPFSVMLKEREIMGADHCMVGVLVAKKWQLPTAMINAIMLHHTQRPGNISNEEVRLMVAMLQLSNAVVAEISLGAYRGEEMRLMEKTAMEELMLDEDVVAELRANLITYNQKL